MYLKIEPALLPALAAFECVARHENFSRAAADMGLSPSALSQSVRNLERRLGVRLLTRTTRRVRLTEEGAAILEQVRGGLTQLSAALETLEQRSTRPAGTVRITLPRMAFARYFLPRLTAFRERYPDVEVEFSLDDHLIDIVGEGFDVGVRLGEQLDADMVALPLGPSVRLRTVAAPAYFERHPVPQTPDELGGHDCSRYRFASSGRVAPWMFQRDGEPLEVKVDGTLLINDLAAEIEIARSGLALIQTVESHVIDDIRAGRLVPVLDTFSVSLGRLYLYFPSRAHMAPRLRAFIDHFRAEPPPETTARSSAGVKNR
ncbi:LysR family transcriptional regulator [Nitrogeniibacter mangrovi]|uniref:LysR family transcriptional regulator n=1 Tax=Nitrogeniibacter mangrovi TaxID=2016596 RepID=A0A6C1B6N4_9RHOO|nr:LysR family transcriptional regulator [Nitrogeniibacter mangrovi]QID17904.1 LysR family transcriptional regulator [Nitrogeniibacter mangrovi]